MGILFDILANVFVGRPIDHPFRVVNSEPSRIAVDPVEPEEERVSAKWGNRVETIKREFADDGAVWDRSTEEPNRLKPVDLDSFDWAVIRANNLSPNNFKLCKPYVLAQLAGDKLTYSEIGVILGFSESWVQRLGPRIKEAAKERAKASTPTP